MDDYSKRRAVRPDPLTSQQRSHNMSRIRGRDTGPEWILRRALHARGLRYRLHVKSLTGTPDIVFPARRAIIFVHGCFWHGHDCPKGSDPRYKYNLLARQNCADTRKRPSTGY